MCVLTPNKVLPVPLVVSACIRRLKRQQRPFQLGISTQSCLFFLSTNQRCDAVKTVWIEVGGISIKWIFSIFYLYFLSIRLLSLYMSQLASKHLCQVRELFGNMDQFLCFCVHTQTLYKIQTQSFVSKVIWGDIRRQYYTYICTSIFLCVGRQYIYESETVIVCASFENLYYSFSLHGKRVQPTKDQ